MVSITGSIENYRALLHEFQLRDKIKSAEHHYSIGFDFEGVFDDFLAELLFEKIVSLSKEIEFDSFKLGVSWPLEMAEEEKKKLKTSIQTALILKIKDSLKKRDDFSAPHADFLIDFNKKLVLVRIKSVFVSGRYCKFSREIAQTEYFCNKCRGKGCWYCKGMGHFCEESVEQFIAKIFVPAFGAALLILHGAGREDMDVLMLGNGRPFVAELLMPKKRGADLKLLKEEFNIQFKGKASINSLKICSIDDVSPLKDSPHNKIYAALVSADKDIDLNSLPIEEKLLVFQFTPTRVEKRRANLERAKEVTIIHARSITKRTFVLELLTSHGTYVKEFISGDGGKTKPSISSLTGAHCICTLLDVLEVCS